MKQAAAWLKAFCLAGTLQFFVLQGLVLIFDMPVSLSQFLNAALLQMPARDVLSDWALLALIVTLLNVAAAVLIALFCILVQVLELLPHRRAMALMTVPMIFAFVASAAYSILVGFPQWQFRVLGVSSTVLIALAVGAVVVMALLRRGATDMALERLSSAGKLFSVLMLLALPVTFISGVRLEGFPHARTAGPPSAPVPLGKPNIVVVIADALRASAMSVYGSKLETTPHIDGLARSAAVVDGMTAVSNFTVPTTATMFSGMEPFQHRVASVFSYVLESPAVRKDQLAPQILRDAGYQTAAIVENLKGSPVRLRIASQFQDVYTPLSRCDPTNLFPWQFVNSNISSTYIFFRYLAYSRKVASLLCRSSDSDALAFPGGYGEALEWLDGRTNTARPFLLWVHLVPPHEPYTPPAPFMRSINKSEKFVTPEDFWRASYMFFQPNPGLVPSGDVAIMSDRYLENVKYVDSAFSRFFEELKKRGLMDSTVIFLTSDHGETFGRWITHDGPYLDQDLVNVPFIAWGKGFSATHVPQRVSQADIAPTILDVAGIAPSSQMTGRSLLTLLRGKQMTPRPVFSSQLSTNSRWTDIRDGSFSVLDGDWQYVRYPGRNVEELFDLRRDPLNRVNLVDREPQQAARLRRLLAEHFSSVKTLQ